MAIDPLERNVWYVDFFNEAMSGERITVMEPSEAWSWWRDNLVLEMYNRWKGGHHWHICCLMDFDKFVNFIVYFFYVINVLLTYGNLIVSFNVYSQCL